MAFDPAADGDDQVFVFERHGEGWRQIPSPLPAAYEPPPVTVHWHETTWLQTVEGWARHFEQRGSFLLTEELREQLSAGFREAVAAGRVTMSSTADEHPGRTYLNDHINAARAS